MSTLNINTLLASLETSAGIEKVASETSVAKPNVSEQLSHVLEKKAGEDLTKVAFAEGEKLAKELLSKLASNELVQGTAEMVAGAAQALPTQTAGDINAPMEATVAQAVAEGAKSDDLVDQIEDKKEQTKEAQIKSENLEMANLILTKIAQIVGEETTTPAAAVNVAGAAVPNMIQEANAAMTAQDDAKVLPMPGQEGDLNTILEAVVARAEGQGAVSDDLVNGDSPASGAESNAQVDEQEKAAAVDALVGAGFDFDSAVDMVKQAEFEIQAEELELEKAAAFEALTEAGVDFDDAIALIKQAEEEIEMEKFAYNNSTAGQSGGAGPTAAQKAKMKAKELYESAKGHVSGAYKATKADAKQAYHFAKGGNGLTVAENAKQVWKTKTGKVGAALAAAGAVGGGYAAYNSHHKKAAVDQLVADGYDFDSAVDMVKVAYNNSTAGQSGGAAPTTLQKANMKAKELYESAKGHGSAAYGRVLKDAKDIPDLARIAKTDAKTAFGLAKGNSALGLGLGALALGGAGYAAHRHNEKRAAFEALVEAGVDFDSAVDMVKQAEYDVYGE